MRPSSSARPGTGQRVGTGRSSAAPAAFVGAPSDVRVSARPQTGLGLRAGTAGPGRQVQDVSYFSGVLRSKISEISVEISRMRADTERATRDASLTVQLERRYDGAMKEVRALEGDLADYNLAMDKARTNVDVGEINAFLVSLKRRNEAAAKEVEQVFMERAERERGAARLEDQITELKRTAEARIASLPPAELQEYRKLQAENAALARDIERKQGELEAVNADVEAAEEELRRDRVRDEFAAAQKRLSSLQKEHASLQEEMAASRLDPATARERLLARVKTDNARMQAIEKEIKVEEDAIASRRKAVGDLDKEVEERRGEAGDAAKYEALFKKDAEMTEFIDCFPDALEKEKAEARRLGERIVALLEHASENLTRQTRLPSKAQAAELKEDLDDKRRELKASEMTADRLNEELALRQTELDKVQSLEGKLSAELRALDDRMRAMDSERPKFADIDGLRAVADRARVELRARIDEHTLRRDAARPAGAAAERELAAKRAALKSLPQALLLEAAEGQLKNSEAVVFALRENISTIGRDSDFEPVKNEVSAVMIELNIILSKLAADVAAGIVM